MRVVVVFADDHAGVSSSERAYGFSWWRDAALVASAVSTGARWWTMRLPSLADPPYVCQNGAESTPSLCRILCSQCSLAYVASVAYVACEDCKFATCLTFQGT